MRGWFGPRDWGAPILKDLPRIAIPVGETCIHCDHEIGPDEGFSQFLVRVDGSQSQVFTHEDCSTYSAAGSKWCGNDDLELENTAHRLYHDMRDHGVRPRVAERCVDYLLEHGLRQ